MPDRTTANAGDSQHTRKPTVPVPRTTLAAVCLVLFASCGKATKETEESATDPVHVAAAGTVTQPAAKPVAETSQTDEFDRLIQQLESGVEWLSRQDSYSAEVMLQEQVHGELLDPHVVNLVCRHDPFSVFMKWTEGPVGRETIYVSGRNRDRVVVHPEGLRGRIVSRIKLEQNSPLIMSERRYPISEFGLLKLNERLLRILKGYAAADIDVACDSRIAEDASRPGTEFDIEVSNRLEDDIYRRVTVLLDEEHAIAVSLCSYTWPETAAQTEEETLIESYDYRSIDFGHTVTDETFDPANPEYHFAR